VLKFIIRFENLKDVGFAKDVHEKMHPKSTQYGVGEVENESLDWFQKFWLAGIPGNTPLHTLLHAQFTYM
jgi:hypothetical protein